MLLQKNAISNKIMSGEPIEFPLLTLFSAHGALGIPLQEGAKVSLLLVWCSAMPNTT
ncbi:hypothetical protein PMIT1303_00037 [Prochlorococcus sp. MIT 1303]|nr:hypothetical protein PMIT1303_00037 [Prochlorococcus sp. MIT 1303]